MANNVVYERIVGSRLAGTATVVPVPSYEALKSLIVQKHPPTAEHSIRVRICATKIGQLMGLSGFDLSALTIAAELHDIGKIQLPQSILDSSGKLSESDWQLMRQHPLWGAVEAERSFPSMPDIAVCIKLHHERLDGSGYPYAVTGNRIPYLARIIAIADVFAALTEDRPYRRAYTDAESLHILFVDEAGRYDDQLLTALASCIR